MVAFNKIQNFVEDVLKGKHDFTTHIFKVALSNTAPNATDTILTDITQISASGGYAAGGYTLDNVTLSETGGTAKVDIDDEVVTASGGSIGPFQYFVLYNDSTAGDPLVGWYTRASAVTLADGESITIDFDASNGVFTLA